MNTTRRPIAFAAAIVAALFVIAAHTAARPAAAVPASASPATVAVPAAPAPVYAPIAAPAGQPAAIAAAPVPTPEHTHVSVASIASDAADFGHLSPVVGGPALAAILALAVLAARRAASPRRPICA